MSTVEIKLPDVGEGIAEAEIVEVLVRVGDSVREDQPLLAVMTDKATVEVPSPVAGTVTWLSLTVGARVAIGTHVITIDAAASSDTHSALLPAPARDDGQAARPVAGATTDNAAPMVVPAHTSKAASDDRPLAAPSVRAAARAAGLSLETIDGSGPGGRILHVDLERQKPGSARPIVGSTGSDVEIVPITGLRRVIAERLQDTKRRVPHFSYVEEIDVTELEALRHAINRDAGGKRPKLTLLPFIARSLVRVLPAFPDLNARFDDVAGGLHRFRAVHLGIATQTPRGLMVPVVRHAEHLDLFGFAQSVTWLAEAARDGSIAREDLSGSTITITSLGTLGGFVTTPVLNSPEVAIIGVNRIATRPVWRNGHVEPRQLMNLSSSFDHRIVDGFVAAEFVQAVKQQLEQPARLFVEA